MKRAHDFARERRADDRFLKIERAGKIQQMQCKEKLRRVDGDNFFVKDVGSAVGGVHAAEAVEKIWSGHVAGKAEAGAVREVAIGGEENAAIEIPDRAFGAFDWLFCFFLLVRSVLDARLQNSSVCCGEKKKRGTEKRFGEKGEHQLVPEGDFSAGRG